MIPSTLTLFVAATSSLLTVNALPVFSGFFARNTPASPLARRDLTSAQLAQGSNEFFPSLRLEDVCTPGQVGCINNNTASCSGEGNWEITPCTGNSTCLAYPVATANLASTSNSSIIVTCTNPTTALNAIEQAGGSQELAANFNVTSAPLNATVTGTDSPTPDASSSTGSSTGVPTPTGSSTDVPSATNTTDSSAPTSTCVGDAGSDDGPNDGSDNGNDDGSSSDSGDVPTPTGTDASTDPTGTCSDDPSAEPTETEYITVYAFPDPTNSSLIDYSTVEPLSDPTPTDGSDIPDPTGDNGSDAPAPTDSGNSTTPCTFPDPQASPSNSTDTPIANATLTATPTPTATNTDGTTTDSTSTFTPTAITVPPNFSIASGPVPDISDLGTTEIPATTTTTTGIPIPIRMRRKVRRS